MTADEARKLNKDYLQTLHLGSAVIDKQIKDAATRGKTSIYVNLQNIEFSLRDSAFEDLKKVYTVPPKNFTVKREKHSGDMREPGSDGVFISW